MAVGGGPPPSGRLALVKIGAPVQVGLAGPKSVNVTVPVGTGAGAGAPVTVAVSVIVPPTVMGVGPGWRWRPAPCSRPTTRWAPPHGLVAAV